MNNNDDGTLNIKGFDYDNLVEVFKTNFGQLVRLVKIENGELVETLN